MRNFVSLILLTSASIWIVSTVGGTSHVSVNPVPNSRDSTGACPHQIATHCGVFRRETDNSDKNMLVSILVGHGTTTVTLQYYK